MRRATRHQLCRWLNLAIIPARRQRRIFGVPQGRVCRCFERDVFQFRGCQGIPFERALLFGLVVDGAGIGSVQGCKAVSLPTGSKAPV